MTTIISTHGGMIDKVLGYAVHALFNAPNDLEDHLRKEIDSAIALHVWSETPGFATLGFVVGDVGIRAKLGFAAHATL
jgi:adenylate cyclase